MEHKKEVRMTVSREIKTSESVLKANAKYAAQFKRINCRIPFDLYDKVEATGRSANSVILAALEAYLK